MRAVTLGMPTWLNLYCWRLRLLSSTLSKSIRVSSPTPMRARAMATLEPKPPAPAMMTWAAANAVVLSATLRSFMLA